MQQNPTNSEDKDVDLYFPVEEVHYKDLFDWSKPFEKGKIQRGRLNRQDSKSGSLVDLNATQVALFRYEEEVFAIKEKCPHAGGPLHIGDIEVLPDRSVCVRCPWHSWRIDLRTGRVKIPDRMDMSTAIYPVKVHQDGTIYVGFKEFSPATLQNADF